MIHSIRKPQFAYDALEPYVDRATMEIHTEKHHQTYADKLNAALSDHPDLQSKSLEELLLLDPVAYPLITNMAGGVWNHNFFWSILSPSFDQSIPQSLLNALQTSFGSLEAFQTEFTTKATSLFGSGWTWLIADSTLNTQHSTLKVINLPNQDNPFTQNHAPILALDVWEHAYYLKYQNRRPEYIEGFWHVVNWQQVNDNYINL